MAVEIVAPAAAKIVGDQATKYASPYVSYFFCYGKIVKDFKHHREQLELKKDRVKNDVDEARRQTEVIEKDVQDWLTRAEKELGEAQSLAAQIERSKCFSWCPSWGWRYCLSKKVAKKTLSISKLLETSDFSRVGHRAPLEGIELILSKDVMPFESSKSALNGIMNALKSDAVSMIGLHGMPGVGKTTLAKEVVKQVKKGLFDKVVMVTVSETPNINNIQKRIAEILGLKFEADTEEGRAEELLRRLNDEKKMLIIFDDVWAEMELEPFGIIRKQIHKGCKFLLTTRLHQVCIKMDCQEIFRLDILSEDEAWALFKDNAGLKDVSLALNDVAKQVARECKGLPLAIVTIAKTLKGEGLEGWRVANQRLKDSKKLDNHEGLYSRLKVSYDYLKEDEIRSCFLLCSLFPEDYNISIEMLTICGIGEGLFNDIDLIEERRREIRVAITRLQESGLLLETDDEAFVRMHDVVRDFAHWITAKGENEFMVKDGLVKWPISESYRHSTAVSLWNCKISNFPDKLEFTKLKTLFLMGKKSLLLPNTFFEGTKALRVLFLKDVALSLDALQFLTDLQTLWFEHCKLKNISSLRNIKSLEILALLKTNIDELPEELVELHKLKSLYFSGINFPSNLISRLTSLQELYLKRKKNWTTNLNIWELNSLSHLTALRVSTDEHNFQGNFVFPKLQRYDIAVNWWYDYRDFRSFYRESDCWTSGALRTLTIRDFSSSLSAFKELFCNMEILTLDNVIMEHKNIVPNVDRGGLNELTSLELSECKDLECLIDVTQEEGPATAFSNLVQLKMARLTCLEELCHGQPPIGFLQKLEDMSVFECERLQVVFHMDWLSENLTRLSLWSLPELERIWEAQTHHSSLQSLKFVEVWSCDKLKYIFSSCIPQSLEELRIYHCEGLEQVFGFTKEMDGKDIMLPQLQKLLLENLISLRSFCSRNCSVKLPSLKRIKLHNCPHLTHFMTEPDIATIVEAELEDAQLYPFNEQLSNAKTLTLHQVIYPKNLIPIVDSKGLNELTVLELKYGEELECLIDTTKQGNVSTDAFFNLVKLVIHNMDGLKMFCNGRFPKGFLQKLEKLEISDCMKMVSLSLPLQNLKEVKVIDCDQLQEVFQIYELLNDREKNQALLLSNLTLLELDSLPELKWIWKSPTHYISLQSLKVAYISDCHSLKYLFSASVAQSLLLLEQLKIDCCDGLEHIIEELESGGAMESDGVHLHPHLLPKLTTLSVSRCRRLEYVLQIPLGQGLPLLKSVSITESSQLKQVIVVKEKNGVDCAIALPNLQDLQLENLINLSCFCSENYLIELPSLEKLSVWDCPRLTNFTIQKQVNEHVQLQENQEVIPLSNSTCMELESLRKFVHLQSLKAMEIGRCHKLAALFSPTLAQTLVHLEQLQIDDCESLEHLIIEAKNENDVVSNMSHCYPLCWPKLKTLVISNCKSLKYVFPITLAQGLPCLESVHISDCLQLMQVFDLAKEKDGQDIVLPQLQVLTLENLENLSSFSPGNYSVMLPSLKEFKVCRLSLSNDQRRTFQSQYMQDVQLYGFKELLSKAKNLTLRGVIYPKNLIPIADPKGLNELTILELKYGEGLECLMDTTDQGHVLTNAFFNLVELVILKMDGLKMFCNGRFPKGFLQKLEKFEIRDCMKMVSLSLPLQNLKQVKVINCSKLQEVFQIDELLHDKEKNQALLLSNLTHLELNSLPELKWIWGGLTHHVSLLSLKIAKIRCCHRLKYLFSPSLVQSLVLLEQLMIDHCNGLEHIIEELESDGAIELDGTDLCPPLLPKLTTLRVSHCPRLEYVLQIPLAQGLPLLKSVSIIECLRLKQVIVVKEKNGVDCAIGLPNLQDLRLEHLINLSCFCSKSYLIMLPSLEKLRVWDCPLLTNFTIQKEVNEQVQLQELYLSDLGNDKGCEIINFQLRQSSRNLEYLTVANCEKIFEIQAGNFLSRVVNVELNLIHQLQGPIQAATLQYLRVLKVSKCDRLKSLFSPMLARNLLQLVILHIRHCEELEEIIEVDRTSSSSSQGHLQPIFLPNLEVILIEGCNNLKSLFPVSVIPSLSKLKDFKIQMASKLEQVFGYQSELDVGDDQEVIVFLELRELNLIELPCLERLASMGYHFQFPRLNYVEVRRCTKMTTSFSMDSKFVVHATTEAPQQVQHNTMEGFTTMEEVADDDRPTCNDISWSLWNNMALPLYINVEET